jgi:two-component system chemotaxis response regulator CheY
MNDKNTSGITKKSKILLVDDFLSMKKFLSNLLKSKGYQNIEVTESGEEAYCMLELANDINEPVEFIICDYHMKTMSGLELLKKCKSEERFREIPFVILSIDSGDKIVEECMNEGALAHMAKPPKIEKILELFESVGSSKDSK